MISMKWTRRIHYPGGVYHAMAHGVNGGDIFMDDLDRSAFRENLARIVSESGAELLAYRLLRDRFYVALRIGAIPLAAIMRRLLTGYAKVFNRRHDRSGHLFQARYRASPCRDQEIAIALIHAGADPFDSSPAPAQAKAAPIRRPPGNPVELDEIGGAVAARTSIPITELRSKSSRRSIVAAKRLLAQEAIRRGHTMMDIARWMNSSPATLTRYARHQSENNARTDTI